MRRDAAGYTRRPVEANPFVYQFTKAAIRHAVTHGEDFAPLEDLALFSEIQLRSRGDVDDLDCVPLLVCQVTSAYPVRNAPYGGATVIRARWLLVTWRADEGSRLTNLLSQALVDSWRHGVATPFGSVSSLEIEFDGSLGNNMGITTDFNQFQLTATIIGRR